MTDILGTIANQAAHFIPANPTEYLALQVARKLGDLSSFREYLVLFEHYTEDQLLRAFRRCSENETLTGEHYMRTFGELTRQS